MKCNRKVASGGTCGLHASLRVGVVLRPKDTLDYAYEIGLQAYVCELHAKDVTKEEILTPEHFDALVASAVADVPYIKTALPLLEKSDVLFYDIPAEETNGRSS